MKKVVLKSGLYISLTYVLTIFLGTYSIKFKNELAAMQFQNSKFTYSLYKTFGNCEGYIILIIWLICVYMCYKNISKYCKYKNNK